MVLVVHSHVTLALVSTSLSISNMLYIVMQTTTQRMKYFKSHSFQNISLVFVLKIFQKWVLYPFLELQFLFTQ